MEPGSFELPTLRYATENGYGAEILTADGSPAELRAYLRELDAFEERVLADSRARRMRVVALLRAYEKVPA